MFGTKWETSKRQYGIRKEKNVSIPMSDGITIAADVFRPDATGKFPAILGVQPYERKLQSDPMMPQGLNMANGGIEAGDYNFYVRRGYAHVITSNRGTGQSGGVYDHYGPREVQDTAEVIQWIAAQPWCDGKVGMFGVSAFAVSQQQVAAIKPPHLKALFTPFGYTDFYRDKSYHGGILSHAFLRGWATTLDNLRCESWCLKKWGERKYGEAIREALQDEEMRAIPYLVEALKHPQEGANPLIVDILLNRFDTEYFRERSVDYSKGAEVPAYLGGDWGMYGLHLPGASRSWRYWKGPKKLIIGPPIYLDRPVYQYAYESLRWFDHWLKGIENGIMNEPPVRLYIMDTGEWKTSEEWPLPETRWTPFYLHERGLLSEHEFWPNEGHTTFEDSFMNRDGVTFTTPVLIENTEIIGPMVLNLYASSTEEEILWFISIFDIDPAGTEKLLTRGWLRGSQRELDLQRSLSWLPCHSHTRREPLVPEKIYEFNIEIRPLAKLFPMGHHIGLRVKCVDNEKPTCFPDAAGTGHLWRQSGSRVTIYHDSDHPSRLLLPVTRGNVIGTYMSGGKTSTEFFPYRKY